MDYKRSKWSIGVKLVVLFTVVIGLLGTTNQVLGETAKEILEKVANKHKNLKSYQADLTVKASIMGEIVTNSKMSFKKPNSFRMEGTSNAGGMKIKQTVVSNGKMMYQKIELPQMTQYQKIDLTKVNLPGMGGSMNPSDLSNVENIFGSTADVKSLPKETIDEQEMHVLEGKVDMSNIPKMAGANNPMSTINRARVWIGTKDLFVHKIEMYTKDGKTMMTTRLKNVKLNTELPDKLFTMKIPKGVNVMDMTPMLKTMMKQQGGGK